MPSAMSDCDVVALTSRNEGTPVALIEAWRPHARGGHRRGRGPERRRATAVTAGSPPRAMGLRWPRNPGLARRPHTPAAFGRAGRESVRRRFGQDRLLAISGTSTPISRVRQAERGRGKAIRVLAFVPAGLDRSPGQRYRIEQWAPFCAEAGVDLEFVPFESERLHELLYSSGPERCQGRRDRRWVPAASVSSCPAGPAEYDAVFLYREAALVGPAFIERLLDLAGTSRSSTTSMMLYLSHTRALPALLQPPQVAGKTATICRLAACVTVGNQYLAEYARRWNRSVEIMPTTVDLGRYTMAEMSRSDRPVIGWTGTHSTYQHLDLLRPALTTLAAKRDFVLRVIGPGTFTMPGVTVENRRWRSDSEVDDLRGIDIGVMPLPDDLWSRGKCGAKALQYMALGIPAVCSPVGVNREIVVHGANGLLAEGIQEWVVALSGLVDSETERRRLGLAGRRTVEVRYSAQVHGPRMANVLRAAASGRNCAVGGSGAK